MNRRTLMLNANHRLIPQTSLIALLALTLAGCIPVHEGDAYQRRELGRSLNVKEATVLAIRPIRVTGTRSKVGAAAGAVIGGAAGSTVSSSDEGRIIGGTAGAVVGGLTGAALEELITSGKALEILVELQSGDTIAIVQGQSEDAPLAPGDAVLVVQSDRLRVVPAGSAVPSDSGGS